MNVRSITFRLAAWCAGVSLLVCVAFGFYSWLGLRYFLFSSQATTLQRRARQIAAVVSEHLGSEGEKFTFGLIETAYASAQNDRFVRVRREDGTTLYVSGWPSDGSFDPRKVVATPLRPGQEPDGRVVFQGNLLLVQTCAMVNGQCYIIDCGASRLPSAGVLRGFLLMLGVALPWMFVVAVAGGRWLVRRALTPVRRITDASREITSYNLSRRLPVARTNDEIEHLSVVLNQMIARMDEAFQHSRRFAADASHELRTPLTILRVELESISRDATLDAATREKLASVLEETERLASTVEGLLAITRLDAGEALADVSRFDLAELAASTAEQMALLAEEKRITLRLDALEPVAVTGDRFRLKQVVVNLLDNAIKYTPEGGEIILATHALDGQATLEVCDSGPGIPAPALGQVFNRFFRADSVRTHSVSGTGLGLSIVRSICLAHGGTVEAANRIEGGCRITVRLPLAAPLKTGATTTITPAREPGELLPSALESMRH